jgi:hypothetical protein
MQRSRGFWGSLLRAVHMKNTVSQILLPDHIDLAALRGCDTIHDGLLVCLSPLLSLQGMECSC